MSAKTGYRVVLTPSFTDTSKYSNDAVEFDLIESKSVEANLEVTTYPTVNGDIIADHIIRQPISVTLNGIFSLEGNKPTVFRGGNDRLTNIEQYFEYLKNTGTLCSITTINKKDNASSRFENRNSMVLTGITWTESQNSLGFRFTFTQVMLIDVAQQIDPSYENENLPAITEPSSLSFAEDILDYDNVTAIIIAILYDAGLITQEFLQFVVDLNVSAATGALVGGAIGGIAGAIAVFMGASGPVGWAIFVIGLVAGSVYGVYKAIYNYVKQQQYKVEQFRLYKDDRRNEQEVLRFTNYVSSIYQQILVLDEVVSVYTFTVNEAQKCTVYLSDNYYRFIINKNNSTNKWMLDIYDVEERAIATNVDIAESAIESIDECNPSTLLFRVPGSGAEIYLMNLAASKNDDWYQDIINDFEQLPKEPVLEDYDNQEKFQEWQEKYPDFGYDTFQIYARQEYEQAHREWEEECAKINERNNQKIEDARQEAIRKGANDLANYAILECRIEMTNFNEKLRDVIQNAMTR